MLFLDEDLISHPKMLRAAELLGGRHADGLARAITLWLAGYSFAQKFMTDGLVTGPFIEQTGVVQNPIEIAAVLADKRVGLWHVDPAGYRIHDFHDWNKPAEVQRQKRANNRERQRRWRERHAGNGHA